jgi:acetylornithine/succinyldiaminopimelate/putrescine aminotransferase
MNPNADVIYTPATRWCWRRCKGCCVYGTAGKRYLDLIAGIGLNALGDGHPRPTKVIRDHASK